jgi:hypothetical protein
VTDVLGEIGGALLDPIQQATRLVGEAIDKLGSLTSAGGAELSEVGQAVEQLAARVNELRNRLSGGGTPQAGAQAQAQTPQPPEPTS